MVLRAAQRIDSRVRRVDEALDGPPKKPKRMHWARYEQLYMPRVLWRAMAGAA